MKTISVLLTAILLATLANAQSATLVVQPNTIQSGADGKFEAAPDTLLVQFNIAAQEKTSREAYDRAGKAAEQVRALMRSNGIDPKQAHVGAFSVEPVFDWRAPQRKLVGYRVSTSVELKIRDLAKSGPIVEQLAGIDTAGNQSVSYTLEDMEAAKNKAVQDAFRRARSEADALAQAAGRALGEMSSASIDSIQQGPILMRAMAAKAVGAEQAPHGRVHAADHHGHRACQRCVYAEDHNHTLEESVTLSERCRCRESKGPYSPANPRMAGVLRLRAPNRARSAQHDTRECAHRLLSGLQKPCPDTTHHL